MLALTLGLIGVADAGCSELKDWLDVQNAAVAGFEQSYPAHIADAHRYRDTALRAREIEWMVESPEDWRAVDEQASLAQGHAAATAEALGGMLDQVGEVGADCRKLDKKRATLVVRHGLALGAQQEATRLQEQAAGALAQLPTVGVTLPEAYDQRISALLGAAQRVSDGGGEEAAHELSALVRQLEPWELRAIQEQLPEHPVVRLTVAAALANTGDMRDVHDASKLQDSAGELVDEDLNILPNTAAVWGTLGLTTPKGATEPSGIALGLWATPRRRVMLGAAWERQEVDAIVYSHAFVLGSFDLVGMEAYRPLAFSTGPLAGGGWAQGKGPEGNGGTLTAVLGWRMGVRFRPRSFLVYTVDLEARGTAGTVTPPPTVMLSIGAGWTGYSPW